MTEHDEPWSEHWTAAMQAPDTDPYNSESTFHAVDSLGTSLGDDGDQEIPTGPATWRWRTGEGGPALFRQLSELGRGGMGVVVLAEQGRLKREVAVKTIPSERMTPARLSALQDEARLGGQLEHPNVVPVHDAGDDYVVMRRVQGRTLQQALDEEFDLAEIIELLRKVCDAIAFAHDRGIIHRDLKPSNIMIGSFGEVQVMDWGLALQLEPNPQGGWLPPAIETAQAAAGTPAYLAPEMARAQVKHIGPATDCYLVGAILYRVLSGRPPHVSSDVPNALRSAAMNGYFPLVASHSVPQRLIDLQQRAMDTSPFTRISIQAFGQALGDWLHSIDAEKIAMEAVARGRLEQRKAQQADNISQRYAAYDRSVAAFELALDHWSGCTPASEGLQGARNGYVNAAIENQDLVLARCLAVDDAVNEQRVYDAEYEREHRQRHARRVRLVTIILLCLAVFGAGGLLFDGLRSQQRALESRHEEARALLRQAMSLRRDLEADHVERIQLAFRAAGLSPDDPDVMSMLSGAILDFGRWALARERWGLAESQRDQARWLGDDTVAQLLTDEMQTMRMSLAAERNAIVSRRQDRLEDIINISQTDQDIGDWVEHHAAEIASWDGLELAAELAALVESEDPIIRTLVAAVYGLRPDLDASLALLTLIDDERWVVVDQAWRSLSLVATPELLPQLRSRLLAIDDHWRACELASSFGDQLLAPPLPAVVTDSILREAVRGSMLAFDFESALEASERIQVPTLEDAVLRVRLAGWGIRDSIRCQQAAEAVMHHSADHPWAIAGSVRAAQLAADYERAWQHAQDMVADDAAALMPIQWFAAHISGRADQARFFSEKLLETTDTDPDFDALAVQALQYHGYDRESVGHQGRLIRQGHWTLLRLESERYHGRDGAARRLAHLLEMRQPWNFEAMLAAGEGSVAIGDIDRAVEILEEAVVLRPDHATAWSTLADVTRQAGQAERSLQAWQRAVSAPTNAAPSDALGWLMLLTERVSAPSEREERCGPVIQALARDPVQRARFLPLLVRRLVECDQHHVALQVLLAASRDGSGYYLRSAVDHFCMSHPALRQAGWPGMTGQMLAVRLVEEGLVFAKHGKFVQCEEWLNLAAHHAGDWPVPEQLTGFAALLAAGNAVDGLRLVNQVLESNHQLPANPELRQQLRLWQVGLSKGHVTAEPIQLADLDVISPPLFPIQDCRLHPEDHAQWLEWWLERMPRLPAADLVTVETDLDSIRASKPPLPAERAERGQPFPPVTLGVH